MKESVPEAEAIDGPAEPAAALKVTGLTASVGSSLILQGVDLTVPAGGVTVLMGRNGVGKTTTLRSILGLTQAVTGDVTFQGRSITGLKTHQIARLGIGYVPEDRDVFHALTIQENLRVAELPGRDHDYDLVFALFPELKSRSRQLAGTLSGGQQQMLAVGRVLLNGSGLLLIDEPTKGLAPKVVSELVLALERIAATSTILMVEQNIAVARRLAKDVSIMSHKKIVLSGPAAEVFSNEDALMSYLGITDHRGAGE